MRWYLFAAILALSGCATAMLKSDDPRRAVVLAPYLRPIPPFGQVHIPEGTILYPSVVDGEAAWCSTTPVYFVPGEQRAICMFDPKGGQQAEGWLTTAYIAGSLASLRYDVDVPYRVGERAPLPPRR
jgi:hypothetical protein